MAGSGAALHSSHAWWFSSLSTYAGRHATLTTPVRPRKRARCDGPSPCCKGCLPGATFAMAVVFALTVPVACVHGLTASAPQRRLSIFDSGWNVLSPFFKLIDRLAHGPVPISQAPPPRPSSGSPSTTSQQPVALVPPRSPTTALLVRGYAPSDAMLRRWEQFARSCAKASQPILFSVSIDVSNRSQANDVARLAAVQAAGALVHTYSETALISAFPSLRVLASKYMELTKRSSCMLSTCCWSSTPIAHPPPPSCF